MKYQLMRYFYTQMWIISENGGAFYKPLFFDFPNDDIAYLNNHDNIMIGESLKLSILTSEDKETGTFYFPEGWWCPIFTTYACIHGPKNMTWNKNGFMVSIREGAIIPW